MSYSNAGQPGPPAYAGPTANSKALAGLILGIVGWVSFGSVFVVNLLSLGICSVCTWPVSCLTPLLWLVGAVLGGVGLSEVNADSASYSPQSKSMAIIGLVLNGFGVLITLCGIILIVLSLLGVLAIPFLESLDLSTVSP